MVNNQSGANMKVMNVADAMKNLDKLIKEVNISSSPITITNSKSGNAVLMSEEYYKGLQETLYLNSIPGLSETIIQGDKEDTNSLEKYNPQEDWQ